MQLIFRFLLLVLQGLLTCFEDASIVLFIFLLLLPYDHFLGDFLQVNVSFLLDSLCRPILCSFQNLLHRTIMYVVDHYLLLHSFPSLDVVDLCFLEEQAICLHLVLLQRDR